MVLIMTSVFLSASVVNISRRGERKLPVPKLLRFVSILEYKSESTCVHGAGAHHANYLACRHRSFVTFDLPFTWMFVN